MKLLLSVCILLSGHLIFAQQACQGIEILYPKTDSVIDRTEDQTSTYLILGNTYKNSVLKKVLLLHEKDGSEVTKEVWTGEDDLLKVSAIQQNLGDLDLPNTYWFSALIEQEGHECLFDSGKFKINNNQ